MHYYTFNIGDYRRRTTHLSLIEHGIYRYLLDTYYLEETPLTTDNAKLMRSHCVRTPEEKEAFEFVINEFFISTEAGYVHQHCEEEIEKYRAKSDKARKSAKKRWDNANAMRTHSEGNANHKPITNNQEPITKDQEIYVKTSPEVVDDQPKPIKKRVPFKEIVDVYHELLPELPTVQKLTKTREGYIRQLWLSDLGSIEHWRNFFDYVKSSSFLMGRSEPQNGRRPFRADFEWLIKPSNFVKIAEDRYHG